MLQSFRFSNFRSFQTEVSLSLEPIRAFHEYGENVFQNGSFRVLGQAAIYGANASGKSNVIKALGFMRSFVLRSSSLKSVDSIPVEHFLLDPVCRSTPSLFEVAFIEDGVSYRYGFMATSKTVKEEWLYHSEGPRHKDKLCFERTGTGIQYGHDVSEPAQKSIDPTTILPNSLLLSRLDQNNVEPAKSVMRFFSELAVLSGTRDERFEAFTSQAVSTEAVHSRILEIIRLADKTISDVGVDRQTVSIAALPPILRASLPDKIQESGSFDQTSVRMIRLDSEGTRIFFDMDRLESEGTLKMYNLAGPVLDILENGRTVVVDELEAKLHPHLVRKLLSLFQSSETNPKNAQIVFVTHDTHLLSHGNLRRDQIWFCEKNTAGVSDMYSLAELKGVTVRKKANFERQYIRGRYGAIPFFG